MRERPPPPTPTRVHLSSTLDADATPPALTPFPLRRTSSTDFPDKWQNLIPELVGQFSQSDQNVLQGALRTASSIFKPYRNQYKSNELYRELKYVLDNFVGTSQGSKPFLDLFKRQCALVEGTQDPIALDLALQNLYIILRIYFSLHSQELFSSVDHATTISSWSAPCEWVVLPCC